MLSECPKFNKDHDDQYEQVILRQDLYSKILKDLRLGFKKYADWSNKTTKLD